MNVVTARDGALVTEASELGLAPGQWPATLHATTDDGYLRAFRIEARDHAPGGALAGVYYREVGGRQRRLLVIND